MSDSSSTIKTETTPIDIVQRLAATASRTAKKQILSDAFRAGERDFFRGVQLAYDPRVSFGVQKVAEILPEDLRPDDPGTFDFTAFLGLCDALRLRRLTGNAARAAINAAATAAHGPTWNGFYRPVLLKDLDLGITDKTLNEVLGKLEASEPEAARYKIDVFACQLAENGDLPKNAKKLRGIKLLDVKFDGVRLLSMLDKEQNTVTLYSRSGAVLDNFTEIAAALGKLLTHMPGSVVLDGEVVADSFQALMTQVGSQGEVDTSTAKLLLFDMVPLDDFRRGRCDTPQEERHAVLAELQTSGLLHACAGDLVSVLPKQRVDLDTEAGQQAMVAFSRQVAAAGGVVEGMMIKSPDAPYLGKRSDAWLKRKPSISVSLEIVEIEEGDADGRFTGALGAFVGVGEEDGKKIRTKVGGGFSPAQRADFWARRDDLLGCIFEAKGDKLTRARGSDTYALRFPVFKGFRGRVPGEKI